VTIQPAEPPLTVDTSNRPNPRRTTRHLRPPSTVRQTAARTRPPFGLTSYPATRPWRRSQKAIDSGSKCSAGAGAAAFTSAVATSATRFIGG
jgi:hypothetical protein